MRTFLLLAVIVAFGAFTGYVIWQHGYFGIWQAAFANAGTLQVLLDLIIVCTLACFWMLADARARGLSAWPFLAITLVAGSFGPLLYLVYRTRRAPARLGVAAGAA